jgi:hypothetical protein
VHPAANASGIANVHHTFRVSLRLMAHVREGGGAAIRPIPPVHGTFRCRRGREGYRRRARDVETSLTAGSPSRRR